ncbi:uncharacterized protein RJT21DRAFT_132101 [Scheffersomyces amazonensis]|uniref:uncharacterized protein n=1 Tax=Scheffersomyces amazonensis TaxID=1078765 RepID=UPI00315D6CD7
MLIYDNVKGYSRIEDDSTTRSQSKSLVKVFSNGFDQLVWDAITGTTDEDEDADADADGNTNADTKIDNIDTTTKKKRLTKSEKREQRQNKKINASRNRRNKLQQELATNGKSTKRNGQPDLPFNYNPYIAKAKIRSLHSKIHDVAHKTKREEFKLFQYHSIALYKSDIDHVLPGEWINDNDISLIFEVITQAFLNENSHNVNRNNRFNSQIQLLYPSLVQLFLHFPNSDDIENVLPINDLKKSKFIFIPLNFIEDYDEVDLEEVNNGDHWALGLLSILENKLYIYDSMVLEEAIKNDDKILQELTLRLKSCKNIIKSSNPIEVVRMKCDQQDNFDDCGVYLMMITCILIKRLLFPGHEDNENEDENEDEYDNEFNDENDYQPKPIDLDVSDIKFNVLGGRLFIMDLIYKLYIKLKV